MRSNCKKRLEEFKQLVEGDRAAIERVNLRSWCTTYFSPITQCACVDNNNNTEAYNMALIAARSKNIISMLEEIESKVCL